MDKKYTDKQLLERVASLTSFRGWPETPFDVWVRSAADKFNEFDDKVYTFDGFGKEKAPEFIMVNTGTTNAGKYGLLHFDEYNADGCAVLKSDWMVYNSHAYGRHKNKYPAYVQARAFPYYRDRNKNERAEENGIMHVDIIGANCHKAGVTSTRIDNWSVACLVRNVEAQFDKWLTFMNKRPLTVAILKEF